MLKLVCFSDTHGAHRDIDVPDGDVLIFAGDLGWHGTEQEVKSFLSWFHSHPHNHKIMIAGNHDWLFQKDPETAQRLLDSVPSVVYLQDQEHIIEGIKFYGAPWRPEFNNWAFNLPRNGPELETVWAKIPDDTDVLITHGPPWSITDKVPGRQYFRRRSDGSYSHHQTPDEIVGCELLWQRVREVKPQLHVFGDIHEGAGKTALLDGTYYMNVSHMNAEHFPILLPQIVEVSARGKSEGETENLAGSSVAE